MLLSHLLSHDMDHHRAALLQEAEHARLVRLARSETTHHPPRWFALLPQESIRLFWHQAVRCGRAEIPVPQRNVGPALPAAYCCACSC